VAASSKPVERLFPFALRAGLLVVGREVLWRLRKRIHFVLLTTDLSANSLQEIRRDFAEVTLVQRYISADLEGFFKVRGTKVVGFKKSALARSLLRELASFCIHKPVPRVFPVAAPAPADRPSQAEAPSHPPAQGVSHA
jgi:hypothetical protein